jgi:16S rRNA (cytosine1402-N4)-methyltransferase
VVDWLIGGAISDNGAPEAAMTDAERPPRRPRYRGRNPRAFHEKYKEHQPERYADDVAKVLAAGKTPAGSHRPIMVREVLAVLAPRPGEIALDCTLGYGGHARELLAAVQPGGRLLGVDVDPLELPRTEERLRALGHPPESLVVERTNFAGIGAFVATHAPEGVDILFADLGCSSMQLDDPTRGFAYKADGPLDMRMNPRRSPSAAELLARLDAPALAELLVHNADEPQAESLAVAIIAAQRRQPLTTTQALADVVRAALPARASDDASATVRRVFQALRIAVNDEFGVLDALLRQLPHVLKPGGRVAVLTFHSGEDRRVKQAFRDGLRGGVFTRTSEEALRPTLAEQRDNPRSSPAKLRWAVRST